ncbi:MAG: hypothetical protein ACYSTL_08225, partial [Planctomycetota bacterium]
RAILSLREAFFRERISTRILLTLLFCLLAHPLWVTLQSLLGIEFASWSQYGWMLLQAVSVSVYSAAIAPLIMWLLGKLQIWIFTGPPTRTRRTAPRKPAPH